MTPRVTPSVSEGPGGAGGAPPIRPGPSLTLGLTKTASLELIVHVLANICLHPLRRRRRQANVVDRHRRAATRRVRRDRRGGPVRRLGHAGAEDAERRRLAIEDHERCARYGAVRLRTYFAIMSNSRLTWSPRLAVPRFVRRSVSGIRAAPNVVASGSTIVSDTPSTAIEPLLTTSSANSDG